MYGMISAHIARYEYGISHSFPLSQSLRTNHYQRVLLDQLAHMRAALFRYNPPLDYANQYLRERIFDFKPESFSMPVAPTREFWIHVFESKIKATIKNEGDMIGWDSDEETVGPIAFAAKQSLLCAIPHIMPLESTEVSLYRLVLEHGDFGIHNTTITKDVNGEPLVTSLYDWETGCIVPALLSDTNVAAGPVDLITDEEGGPCVTRIPKDSTSMELETYALWARNYIKVRCHVKMELVETANRRDFSRSFTVKRLTMRLPSELGKTYATCGLHYETGVVVIQKNSSAASELGQRNA